MLVSDLDTIQSGINRVLEQFETVMSNKSLAFSPSKETLKKSLEALSKALPSSEKSDNESGATESSAVEESQECNRPSTSFSDSSTANTPVLMSTPLDTSVPSEDDLEEMKQLNVTDEEKEQRLALESPLIPQSQNDIYESLAKKPFLETIINSLLCTENDYAALFALCLLYALANNQVIVRNFTNVHLIVQYCVMTNESVRSQGISRKTLDIILSPFQNNTSTKNSYNELLMDRLIHIITLSCQTSEFTSNILAA